MHSRRARKVYAVQDFWDSSEIQQRRILIATRNRRDWPTAEVGKYGLDSRWIAHYNTRLYKKFNKHINMEMCAPVKSVKHLYKQVYNDHDVTSVRLHRAGTDKGLVCFLRWKTFWCTWSNVAGQWVSHVEKSHSIYPISSKWPYEREQWWGLAAGNTYKDQVWGIVWIKDNRCVSNAVQLR
jgi:hypothetical protein